MNPYLILAGVVALLAFRNSKKGQAPSSSGSAPVPSPANPAGLDAPTGPSPSGVPEVRETTTDPIASPANPTGLDAAQDSSPSGVPEIIVAEPEEFVVVDDGNWSESPANPLDLSDIVSPAGGNGTDPIASPANPAGLDAPTGPSTSSDPIASPANPKGLDSKSVKTTSVSAEDYENAIKKKYAHLVLNNTDPTLKDPQTGLSLLGANISGKSIFRTDDGGVMVIGFNKNYPYLNREEVSKFKKLANSYGRGEPIKVETGRDGFVRQFGGFGSFERWLLGQTGFTTAQAGKGKLAGGPYSLRIYLLAKQKGLLNVETIKKYIQYRDQQVAEFKAQLQKSKERAAKPKPKVFAGKVLDANGNYVTPKGQQDCPDGYKYISNAGWTGCVTPERYEEWAIKMAYAMNDIPVRLTSWTGIKNGVQVRNSRKFSKFITYPEHIFKKAVSGYGLSYATSLQGLTNSFEFKDSFWGTKDGKYVVFYGKVKVKMNDGKTQKFYVIYPVTKEEFDKWKQAAYYIELSKKNK